MSAITSAAAFTNDHHFGKYLYALAASAAGAGALYFAIAILGHWRLPLLMPAFLTAIYTGIAISWLRPLRVAYA
jgi:hypothetical protein